MKIMILFLSIMLFSAQAYSMTAPGNRKNCTPPCCEPKGCSCADTYATFSSICNVECMSNNIYFTCGEVFSCFRGCLTREYLTEGSILCCESDEELYCIAQEHLQSEACNSLDCFYKKRAMCNE